MAEVHIVRRDGHAALFLGLADQGVDHRFVGFEMAARQVPGSVLEAGVLALAQQYFVPAAQQQVNVASHLVPLRFCLLSDPGRRVGHWLVLSRLVAIELVVQYVEPVSAPSLGPSPAVRYRTGLVCVNWQPAC